LGGRFGKYGDVKRKDRLRRKRPFKKNVSKIKPEKIRARRPARKKGM
jgi:hypothetical protein